MRYIYILAVLLLFGCTVPNKDIVIVEFNELADRVNFECQKVLLTPQKEYLGCAIVMENTCFIMVPEKDDPNYDYIKAHEVEHCYFGAYHR